MKKKPAINDLLGVVSKLRAPNGCPWDREQDHQSMRRHAIEEVYELIDAIEARDGAAIIARTARLDEVQTGACEERLRVLL